MAEAEKPRTLREWREERGLTTLEVAAFAHVSVTTVLGLETGDRSPNIATAQKIAAVLGVTILDIEWPTPEETQHQRRLRKQREDERKDERKRQG
mgnify:CR=1 FL=1